MNFLIPERGLVFIHIPKNAGSAIKLALGGKPLGPVAGYIPDAWKGYHAFAVVRHPITRFLSGLNMFRVGAANVSEADYYSKARMPSLTVSQALDILEDDSITHDRSVRNVESNLKHHLWPQTSPFNCLNSAQTVLRYENLEEDFATFCNQFGDAPKLPVIRRRSDDPSAIELHDLSSHEIFRITRFYAEDFTRLGYNVNLFPAETRDAADSILRVYEAWPHIFGAGDANENKVPLPFHDVDLLPFMRASVPSSFGTTWPGREINLAEHFRRLEPEFSDRPYISLLLACSIVVLRRDAENSIAKSLFMRILTEHGELAAESMNSRWLTSVCDTLVDIGEDDLDRALGMAGTLFSNTLKLAESELRYFHPARPWPPKKMLTRGGLLYDGVITFWIERGDAVLNLLERIEKVLSTDSRAAPFVRQLVNRAIEEGTVFSRVASLAGKKIPLAAKEDIKRLEAIMKRL